MKKLIAIPFFIFLFLFIVNADAYTLFNPNPHFTYTNGAIALFSTLGFNTTNASATWYDDCGAGMTTCVNISDLDASNAKIDYVFMENSNGRSSAEIETSSSITDFYTAYDSKIIFTLPAYKDGLFTISYKFVDTPETCWNGLDPSVYIQTTAGSYLNYTTLNTSISITHNTSLLISSASSNRYLRIFYIGCGSDQTLISKYKFYSVDENEVRDSWDTNQTEEDIRYCGSDYKALSLSSLCTDSSATPTPVFKNYDVNRSWHICKTNESDYVVVVKMQNMTLARRVLNRDMPRQYTSCVGANDVSYLLWQLTQNNYFGYWTSAGCDVCWGFHNYWFIEKLSLLETKITMLSGNYSNTHSTPIMVYNGAVVAKTNLENTTRNGLYDILDNVTIRQTVSLLPYMNTTTPAGTLWRLCQETTCQLTGSSAHSNQVSVWYSFFTALNPLFNATWVCNPATNMEYYQQTDGNLINHIYCGDCGCGTTRCNKATWVGTICSNAPEQDTYLTASGCSFDVGVCPTGYVCVNQSEGSILCNNTLDGETGNYIINSTGGNVTYSIPASRSTDFFSNPANAVAVWFGGLFGISESDIATSKFITSIWISLLVALLPAYMFRHTKSVGSIYISAMLMALALFVKISWFDSFYFIVLLIIDAFLITGFATKIFGGAGAG